MSTQQEKLKAIADAIREKDGTTEPIPASDFPARILAISTVPDGLYTIALSVDDEAGGIVSGGGLVEEGVTVTIKAAPSDDYQFTAWQENGETVSEDAEYTFTVSGDRALVAVFEVAKVSRLPEGYTELEYIQSGDRCVLPTATKLNLMTDGFVIDIEALNFKYSGEYIYYGSIGTSDLFSMSRTSSSKLATIVQGYSPKTTELDITNKRVKISLFEQNVSINDIVLGTRTKTGEIRNFYLFSSSSGSTSICAKLYSCQMYTSGDLTRDFVPCIDPTGAVGLYDLVTAAFFANAGTGAFTAGPAV